MAVFSHDELLALHEATMSADLGAHRDTLLAGVPPEFVLTLPIATTASAQVLSDLDKLNSFGVFNDGTAPLGTWLANAVALSASRPEVEFFRSALEACRNRPSSNVPPPALNSSAAYRPYTSPKIEAGKPSTVNISITGSTVGAVGVGPDGPVAGAVVRAPAG